MLSKCIFSLFSSQEQPSSEEEDYFADLNKDLESDEDEVIEVGGPEDSVANVGGRDVSGPGKRKGNGPEVKRCCAFLFRRQPC